MHIIWILIATLFAYPCMASDNPLEKRALIIRQNLPRPIEICHGEKVHQSGFQSGQARLTQPSPKTDTDFIPDIEKEFKNGNAPGEERKEVVIYFSSDQIPPEHRTSQTRPCVRVTIWGTGFILLGAGVTGLIYWLIH